MNFDQIQKRVFGQKEWKAMQKTARKEMFLHTQNGIRVISSDGSRKEMTGDPATWPEDYRHLIAMLNLPDSKT